MERREFLNNLWAWILTIAHLKTLDLKALDLKIIEKKSRNYVDNIIKNIDFDDKVEKTINSIWEIEYNNFLNFFFFNYWFTIISNKDIYNKIIDIQEDNWLKKDWIIWKKTLKIIYKNYYSSNLESCYIDIQKRWEIYTEMIEYPEHPRKKSNYWNLEPSHIPNVFDKNYYYWQLNTKNLENTFIDENLFLWIDEKIKKKWNQAVLKNYNWKFIVLLYIDGILQLASYASPWNWKIKGWMKTILWKFNSDFSDKYYISWAKASVKNWKWAIMPYAVHIRWWIFVHSGNVNWSRLSHWCIRLPLYYAKWFYEFFNNYWDIEWNIIDN